jgi:Glycosyltransferase family 25 (LPS biosynthesis protein)
LPPNQRRHPENADFGGIIIQNAPNTPMPIVDQLRDFFARVVVVNLSRRPQRLSRFNQNFQNWPFKTPQRFEAIDGLSVPIPADWKHGPGAWGCMLSHRAVLSAAIQDNVSTLFVLEDDALPAPDFSARAADFLNRVPQDWDCLMFGAEHMRPPTPVSPGIVRCVASNRTHAFALRGNMMPILLGFWNHFNTDHCDIVLSSLMRHFKAYAPDPFLIGQDAGISDITGRRESARFLPDEILAATA